MKKVSTAGAKQIRNFPEQKLTIGLDLGDRSSWYCVLDEAGEVLLEQRLGTTPKAMKEVFGGMPRSRIALETGMHSPLGEPVAGRIPIPTHGVARRIIEPAGRRSVKRLPVYIHPHGKSLPNVSMT